MNAAAAVAILLAAQAIALAVAVLRAPEGHEDEDGFHYGSEKDHQP